MDSAAGLIIHAIDKIHQARLSQCVLRTISLTENREEVGLKVIFYNTYASDRKYVINVADILRNLIIGLLKCKHVLLKILIRFCIFSDITTCTEYSNQFAVDIVDGHKLQLIIEFLSLQHLVERTVV